MKKNAEVWTWRRQRSFAIPALAAIIVVVGLASGDEVSAGAPGFEVRTIDGTGNNLRHPERGSAGIALLRLADAKYEDRISAPGGVGRRSAREISNILAAQDGPVPNSAGASDFIWQWGQFLDHDIDLTPGADPAELFNIEVPVGDPFFDPFSEGGKVIALDRSIHDGGSTRRNPRQQLTVITAFIDASNVYGSDDERAAELRTFDGGKLKTTQGGNFLPFNTAGLPNAGGPDPSLYLAGDVRANEQIALTAMHTLFVREHNRLCDEIAAGDPGADDEEIYQRARKIVGAQMQVITYQEFLPFLLGGDAIPAYSGYDPRVDPGIANEFSTASYRFGHSQLSPTLLRLNKKGSETENVELKDAFFNPEALPENGGIDSLLRGLAAQSAQEVDTRLVDGVRNFLFGPPGSGGFDLASLNMQRGRDHGLADYNAMRKAYGLREVRRFSDVTSDSALQDDLADAYGDVNDVDAWMGGLAEDHVPGALVGELVQAVLAEQFIGLRDGDRFWYQNDPFFTTDPGLTAEVEGTTLADIIRRNTKIGDELQDDVFRVAD